LSISIGNIAYCDSGVPAVQFSASQNGNSQTPSTSNLEKFEINKFTDLKVFPNPATKIVRLNFPSYPGIKYHTKIRNILGGIVFESLSDGNGLIEKQIDVSNWIPGVYTITVEDGNRILSNQLIVQ